MASPNFGSVPQSVIDSGCRIEPSWSCEDWADIDGAFIAAETYYAQLGILPPDFNTWDPKAEQNIWYIGVSDRRSIQHHPWVMHPVDPKPAMKRRHEEILDMDDYEIAQPLRKIAKSRAQTSPGDVSGLGISIGTKDMSGDGLDGTPDTSSESSELDPSEHESYEVRNTTINGTHTVDMSSLNSINDISSDTESNAADVADDTTSYYSSSSSSSDDTEAVVERSVRGVQSHADHEVPTDEILNFRPASDRPNFDFAQLKTSPVASMLPEFLAQMEAANNELNGALAAGNIADHRIEMDDGDEIESKGQYIEMSLGLGVLEQKNEEMDTSSECDSSDDGQVMNKLMGVKSDDVEEKQVKIEEL